MSIQIIKGIQIPAFDVEMLSLGKLIAIPFKQYVPEGQAFWLYPSQHIPSNLTREEYYQPEFLSNAQETCKRYSRAPVLIKTWASAEYHWHMHSHTKELLLQVARSTVWNVTALEHMFEENQVLKLLFLRVHRLPEPMLVNAPPQSSPYYFPSSEDTIVSASEQDTPAISTTSFIRRRTWLVSGVVYPYTSLESLVLQAESNASEILNTTVFKHRIKQLLGWQSSHIQVIEEPKWISEISLLGDRSKEDDEGKSNYQAGTDFENIVRKSLELLGFSIDYSHKGGAGGLDLFCSHPYPLVGECKSGKKIPNDTAVQLLNLGTIRLENKETFSQAAKLIIGPGEPTDQLKRAARVHGMAIITPTTLEKLVKLHHKYPVDLLKLKEHLIDGQADEEVEKFIGQVSQSIKLRSHIVELTKHYLENANDEDANVSALHAIYIVSKPPQPLRREEMHEILIELSSPLTGYLGRKKGSDGSDRFYFLRDLSV
ncbi:MAG: DUF1802 family protein [Myxacorys chilensis ATA2-1-KO14]|jgi:hypothetical protein|nr:DUF1802 family protein [Myxacorys chilensis ATA2-1-KO14]